MKPLKPLMILLAAGLCQAPATWAADSGPYIGALGGLGTLQSTSLQQLGTVRLPHPLPDLPIDADGSTDRPHLALGGLQLGYQWDAIPVGASAWRFRPAAELEGLYLGRHTPKGDMPVDPSFLGTQYVTIPTTGQLLMASVVFALETPYSQRVFPYVGVGAGMARLSISGADSANPSEPGINHFNSDSSASDSAFAYQLRLGLKGQISRQLSVFTEYRYLSIAATRYGFGATDYPGEHPPTDTWDVRLGRLSYDLFIAGLQYQF
ncbi:outer membrane protein [Castellaniella sp.]|uniref:outer membrane protein n=1 Tax=Castellaniella sp. TaxID=1955812 RepID=UPI002AFFC30D|nr:outer membrane beta-barrel protein [Castellaniella sp.]